LRPNGALDRLARLLAGAAAVFLCAMMMVTVADVVLRSLVKYPIFGTFDLVELFLVTLIFLGLPETFRREEHVVVDLVDHLAPQRVVALLRVLGAPAHRGDSGGAASGGGRGEPAGDGHW
jgi:TRAP-type C4-dicarboxylate transport system permease small subunit